MSVMFCLTKRVLSKADDSVPVFSLNNFEGYAKITSVYDGDTFNACLQLHGRILKFKFRTIGYDSPEMKPSLSMQNRDQHVVMAKAARERFKVLCGFDDREGPRWWNPFICRNRVNGLIWIRCFKNDKYGRPLVKVFRRRSDTVSVNDRMLNSGLVNAYDGGKKSEFDFDCKSI